MRPLPSGKQVRLRELTPDDQDLLDRLKASQGEFTAYAVTHRRPIVAKLADGPLIDEHGGDAVVVRCTDGLPIGTVDWQAVYYGPKRAPFNRVWTIGRELLPEARGQGYGTETLWLMVDWLFAGSDANRIEMHTEPDNVASRRTLERVGFVQEGLIHGAVYRAGAYRDMVVYGLTRSHWEER